MKIQITESTWNGDCTTDLNLTQAHAKDPAAGYDKVIMYAEKRYLMTFIAAGATNGEFTASRTTDAYKTRIPSVPDSEVIDGNAWRYKIMGRIQKASVILSEVGTATTGTTIAGGFFQLKMKDNMLVYGMNAMFWNGKMVRVMAQPAGGPGGYVYQFQCYPGDTFTFTNWVAPQIGEKTCFGGYTTYGERSLTGYGRTFYPEDYIQHFSIQRKGQAITGDANANRVLWYATATGNWVIRIATVSSAPSFPFGYQFSHRFNDTWTFRQNARYMHDDVDYYQTSLTGPLDADLQTAPLWANVNDEHLGQFALDNQLQADFDTGAIKHSVLMGADWQRLQQQISRGGQYFPSAINIYNPNFSALPTVPVTTSQYTTQSQLDRYLQDQLSLDHWRWLIGARQDWATTYDNQDAKLTGVNLSNTRQRDSKLTWRSGLSYVFDNGLAPYVSYSESFQPQVGTNREGRTLSCQPPANSMKSAPVPPSARAASTVRRCSTCASRTS